VVKLEDRWMSLAAARLACTAHVEDSALLPPAAEFNDGMLLAAKVQGRVTKPMAVRTQQVALFRLRKEAGMGSVEARQCELFRRWDAVMELQRPDAP
jgi:hypothetical protein